MSDLTRVCRFESFDETSVRYYDQGLDGHVEEGYIANPSPRLAAGRFMSDLAPCCVYGVAEHFHAGRLAVVVYYRIESDPALHVARTCAP